ncbi:MAG: ribosome small subunit-dependent GTPase A [Acidimicrobiales bacterium]
MLQFSGGSLAAFGWNERVSVLYSDLAGPSDTPARVVRVERGQSVVVGTDGLDSVVMAPDAPAVGDWVVIREGAIQQILPRWSELTRRDPDGIGVQTLASNIDLVLVAAPADRLSANRVEREVVVAWDSGARPIVVLTKIDLADPGALADLQKRLVGLQVIASSVTTGEGIDEVAAALRPDLSAVLLGPSGAGKSSLANAILRNDALVTGEVRDGDRRGRHTTASRQLMVVPGGGVLIDTPGLRSLGLVGDITVEAAFPEIAMLAGDCRFSDCSHQVEPGCAVLAGIADGSVDANRLLSFRKLQGEVTDGIRGRDPVERKEAMKIWKARTKAARQMNKRKGR